MPRPISRNSEDPSIVAVIDADPQGPIFGDDADTESAWSQWGEDLKTSQAKGIIRVAKVPTNDDGSPAPHKKGQVQLMSVAHDQYDYDGLLEAVRAKFMKPGETFCIRLTGMRTSGSHSGVVPFNRILMLSRGYEELRSGADNSQLGEILSAMRQQQESQATLLREILQPAPAQPAKTGRDSLDTALALGGLVMPLLTSVVTGLMSRQPQKSDIAAMIDSLVKLKALTDGKSGDSEDDNSMGSIIKAVAPAGMNLLAALAQRQQQPAQLRLPNPAARPTQSVEPPIKTLSPAPVSAQPVATQPFVEDNAMLAVLKPVLVQTTEMAAKNESPVEVAALLSDMLPEEYDEQLYKLVETPQSFARLAMLDGGIKQYAQWYENLRVELLKLYSDGPADGAIISQTPNTLVS
jgi:hypothetical protein